jgi:hypothetical protein
MRKVSVKLIFMLLIGAVSWCVCFFIGINAKRSMCDEAYILSFRQNNLFFSKDDIAALEQEGVCLSYAAYLYPEVSSGIREQEVTVIATNENYPYFTGLDVQEGAFFNGIQEERELQVAVLSKTAAYDLFGNDNCIGETVFINQASYKVIGIVDEKNTDETAKIYIPYQTVSALNIGDTMCNQIWCSFSNMAEASLMMGKAGFSLSDFEIQEMDLYKSVFRFRFLLPIIIASVWIAVTFLEKIKQVLKTLDRSMAWSKKWILEKMSLVAICLISSAIGILTIRRAWCVPPYYNMAGKSGMSFINAVLDFYVLAGMNIDGMLYLKHWNMLSLFCLVICFWGMFVIGNDSENKKKYGG